MNVQRIEVTISAQKAKVGRKERVINIEGDPVASNIGELCVLLENILHPKARARYTYRDLE